MCAQKEVRVVTNFQDIPPRRGGGGIRASSALHASREAMLYFYLLPHFASVEGGEGGEGGVLWAGNHLWHLCEVSLGSALFVFGHV
jgi:hypothetical protein